MGIATLVLTIIGEVGKIAADAVSASQEELSALVVRCEAALAALKGARREAEHNIDMRHADAHRLLGENEDLKKQVSELRAKLGNEDLLDEPTGSGR